MAATFFHLRDAFHQFGDERIRIFLAKHRLRALLPQREPGAVLSEEHLSSIGGVLLGVVPVEDPHRIGQLVG